MWFWWTHTLTHALTLCSPFFSPSLFHNLRFFFLLLLCFSTPPASVQTQICTQREHTWALAQILHTRYLVFISFLLSLALSGDLSHDHRPVAVVFLVFWVFHVRLCQPRFLKWQQFNWFRAHIPACRKPKGAYVLHLLHLRLLVSYTTSLETFYYVWCLTPA